MILFNSIPVKRGVLKKLINLQWPMVPSDWSQIYQEYENQLPSPQYDDDDDEKSQQIIKNSFHIALQVSNQA